MAFSVHTYPGSREFVDLILRIKVLKEYINQADAWITVDAPVNVMLQIMSDLQQEKEILLNLLATPGIDSVAKLYYNNSYDLLAKGKAIITQINLIIAWITSNFPENATLIVNGQVKYIVWEASKYTILKESLDNFDYLITYNPPSGG